MPRLLKRHREPSYSDSDEQDEGPLTLRPRRQLSRRNCDNSYREPSHDFPGPEAMDNYTHEPPRHQQCIAIKADLEGRPHHQCPRAASDQCGNLCRMHYDLVGRCVNELYVHKIRTLLVDNHGNHVMRIVFHEPSRDRPEPYTAYDPQTQGYEAPQDPGHDTREDLVHYTPGDREYLIPESPEYETPDDQSCEHDGHEDPEYMDSPSDYISEDEEDDGAYFNPYLDGIPEVDRYHPLAHASASLRSGDNNNDNPESSDSDDYDSESGGAFVGTQLDHQHGTYNGNDGPQDSGGYNDGGNLPSSDDSESEDEYDDRVRTPYPDGSPYSDDLSDDSVYPSSSVSHRHRAPLQSPRPEHADLHLYAVLNLDDISTHICGRHYCPICMEDKQTIRRLYNCGHKFCCECLQKHVSSELENNLRCPMDRRWMLNVPQPNDEDWGHD